MKIPTKFEMNTEGFKIYFDNNKKTHVCESIETGEKTNIGVLGIFMQMGILKSLEEDQKTDVRLSILSEKVGGLEKKLDDVLRNLNAPETKLAEEQNIIVKEVPTEEIKEVEKSEIKKRVMDKVLEETLSEEKPKILENPKTEQTSKEPNDVVFESKEEIDNWMDI